MAETENNDIPKHQVKVGKMVFFTVLLLVSCTAPVILVVIGFFTSLFGLVSKTPAVVFLSAHKSVIFSLAGIMTIMGYFGLKHKVPDISAVDRSASEFIDKARRISSISIWISVGFYVIGFFCVFVAKYLLF